MCLQATEAADDGDEEVVESTLICACVWGPGNPATVLVMLDAHGQLKDLLHVKQFSGFIRWSTGNEGQSVSVFDDERKVTEPQGRVCARPPLPCNMIFCRTFAG